MALTICLASWEENACRIGADCYAIEGEIRRLNLAEEPPRCNECHPGCVTRAAWDQWSLEERKLTETCEREFGGVTGRTASTGRCTGHPLKMDEKCRWKIAVI